MEEKEIIPIEQDTILFYGKPLIVVRLPDGRPSVVVRSLCENMQLDRLAQIRRIQRTEAIADDLISDVQIETDGGPQKVQVLVLRSVPYWLTGIDAKRTRPELREEIIRYQKEAVDVLYSWAQTPRALPVPPTGMVPAKPITPQIDASREEWIVYHQHMAQWHQHLQEVESRLQIVEQRQDAFEDRMESLEAITDLIPEILERLGPETLTPEHHRRVQTLAQQLQKATGKPHATIYNELKTVFEKPRIQDFLEDEWPQVEQWFKAQIERAKQGKS
jgi:hypothetical protein